ncbi:Alpha/Beta hydrolase protein [Dipodascopsis uninucleata]
MPFPLVGRLEPLEWPSLLLGLFLLMLESVLRFITSRLPGIVIAMFEKFIKQLYKLFLPRAARERSFVHKIADATDFVKLCTLFGYRVEEHIVRTTDGYLLGVHRLRHSKGDMAKNIDSRDLPPKPVVYLHHGLLMNSEIWVCLENPNMSLPFILVEAGYDVWLGNNRGNKYSKKHITLSSNEDAFWNFSMDEFALYDIPDTIDYILSTAKQRTLAYVGFSQGTAQAFGSFSINPRLNEKIRVFVALAPAMAPRGLRLGIVDSLVKASPSLMYLFFGRQAILSSTIFWQSIMYHPLFVRVIDMALSRLFNWSGNNISLQQKFASYSHLYSFTSVKCVVHWFQIMRNRCFQMYDDDLSSPVRFYGQAFYKVAQFPTKNIQSPIYLIYGTTDSLVDIDSMLRELPPHAVAIPVKDHEHLDIIWGRDVHRLVLPHVTQILDEYSSSETYHDTADDALLCRKSLEAFEPCDRFVSASSVLHVEPGFERPASVFGSSSFDLSISESEKEVDNLTSGQQRGHSKMRSPSSSSIDTIKHSTRSSPMTSEFSDKNDVTVTITNTTNVDSSQEHDQPQHTSSHTTAASSTFSSDGIIFKSADPVTGISRPKTTAPQKRYNRSKSPIVKLKERVTADQVSAASSGAEVESTSPSAKSSPNRVATAIKSTYAKHIGNIGNIFTNENDHSES